MMEDIYSNLAVNKTEEAPILLTDLVEEELPIVYLEPDDPFDIDFGDLPQEREGSSPIHFPTPPPQPLEPINYNLADDLEPDLAEELFGDIEFNDDALQQPTDWNSYRQNIYDPELDGFLDCIDSLPPISLMERHNQQVRYAA